MKNRIIRKSAIPNYIYAGRIGEDLLPQFEDQYYQRVQRYDDALMANPVARQMAMRIGYSYMHATFERIVRWKKQDQHLVPRCPSVELGEEGFSWKFYPELLAREPTVLCFGIGTNMTFEGALAERLKSEVHCFDPTPQALAYAEKYIQGNPLLKLHPWGISDKDDTVRFYKNTEPGMGSLSIENLSYGTEYIDAQVYCLETIVKKLDMERVSLLKIDVEGAEYGVIDSMCEGEVEVDQFCLEFDQPVPPWRTERAFEKLYRAGFHPTENWGLNWLFVHERVL